NLRYSPARPSRNQRSADSLVRKSEATVEQRADKAVRAPQKSSRPATISGDTDRLQVCATGVGTKVNRDCGPRRDSEALAQGLGSQRRPLSFDAFVMTGLGRFLVKSLFTNRKAKLRFPRDS